MQRTSPSPFTRNRCNTSNREQRDQGSFSLWQKTIQNKLAATKIRRRSLLLKVCSHFCLERGNHKEFTQIIPLVLQAKAPCQPSASMSEIVCARKRKHSLAALATFQPGWPNLPVSLRSSLYFSLLASASRVRACYEQPGTLTPGYSLLNTRSQDF